MTVTFHGLGEHGRLGNQLWQIAATVGIAHGLDEPVALDPDWVYRPFFSLPDQWFADNWMDKTEASSYATHLPQRWRKYMQDPMLFDDIADEIMFAFQPSPRADAVLDALSQPGPDDVAVHIRRTDYKGREGFLDMLPSTYYRAAGHKFDPGSKFHVYGDDLQWAADYLPDGWEPRRYGTDGDEPTDWCDLMMMARYQRIIVANSSYSYWAAWLSSADVVAPTPWFGRLINVPSPALASWTEVPA